MKIDGKHVLVTGGAGFIGSNLVDGLVARGCRVRVVDDLSVGDEANLDRTNRCVFDIQDAGGKVKLTVTHSDLGDKALQELTIVIGFYMLVSRFLETFDVEIETGGKAPAVRVSGDKG